GGVGVKTDCCCQFPRGNETSVTATATGAASGRTTVSTQLNVLAVAGTLEGSFGLTAMVMPGSVTYTKKCYYPKSCIGGDDGLKAAVALVVSAKLSVSAEGAKKLPLLGNVEAGKGSVLFEKNEMIVELGDAIDIPCRTQQAVLRAVPNPGRR